MMGYRWSVALIHLKLIAFALLLLCTGSDGDRKSGSSSSVFSLFNLKQKSRFWSESIIRAGEFKDLQSSSPGRMASLNFSKAGNVANYLNLLEVDAMYLPVPVNFIFIGFDGKGNYEFKLHPEELERWFTKIDHIFEHSRVPQLGEVFTPLSKITTEKAQTHHLPFVSRINYNYSVHAIQMGEKVSSVFERAINILARREDLYDNRTEETVLWQVDVDTVEVLFSSLVEYLQLENAYNIFILNPKHNPKVAKYGYRRGLSESEINILKQNKSLQTRILKSGGLPGSILALDKIKRPLYEKHPMAKFAWTVTEDTDTVEWHNVCQDALDNLEKFYNGKDIADIVESKVSQELKYGDVKGLHAECLSDVWIGTDRWAFVDLTAGPFSWGPTVGGEGVRTEYSLPNVTKTIGAVTEISEDEAEDQLQDAIQERFAVFGDKDHQAIDILLAEIDIYELFAFKHCKGRKAKLALCEELDERMRELKNELQSFEGEEYEESHKTKAVEALKRMESWNLFTDTQEEFQNYTVARDTFLAHLGATLWGTMRHIISPSIADGSFHFYEKISFQLFFITQERFRNIKQLPVDLAALQEGLSSLLLPSQKPMFVQHMLPLSEDPSLAMAFAVARRASSVPFLLVNGTYRKTIRSYLDSSILQYQLQRLNDHGSLKGLYAHSRSTLEVPIFWFIHRDQLLIDRHYQAKALSDMVIVVQSETSSWESHLQCNGQSLLWDLRRPVKAALAATAEHLAGLLPLHLVYSQAHETVTEDWVWSVGCSPLSITSQGWHISRFHSDTIARSYIITALEESLEMVNSAIHRLVFERTSEKTYKTFESQERDIVNKYNHVVSLWKRVSTSSGELRYVDALRVVHTLEDASQGFADQVNTTIALFHPIQCMRERKVDVELDMTTIPAFVFVGGVIFILLRPRRAKPKIN